MSAVTKISILSLVSLTVFSFSVNAVTTYSCPQGAAITWTNQGISNPNGQTIVEWLGRYADQEWRAFSTYNAFIVHTLLPSPPAPPTPPTYTIGLSRRIDSSDRFWLTCILTFTDAIEQEVYLDRIVNSRNCIENNNQASFTCN